MAVFDILSLVTRTVHSEKLGGGENAIEINDITRFVMSTTRLRASLGAAVVMVLAGTLVCGCTFSVDELISENALQQSVLTGTYYQHVIFRQTTEKAQNRLHVYIGGDGQPWIRGHRPASDPTPNNPLALRLMTLDTANAVFIGRPCFFGLAGNNDCHPDDWTFARYSEKIIDSMSAVIQRITIKGGYEEILIIGYSGGGVIARLVAAKVPHVLGVLTINGNLDINAWTEFHDYLPLTRSRNPADAMPLPARIPHVQAVGGKDEIVPPLITESYRQSGQKLQVWLYPEYDHVCCWLREWPEILARFESSQLANVNRKY
jgi:pimeloyl-ACP methyl ester carboxylesterase